MYQAFPQRSLRKCRPGARSFSVVSISTFARVFAGAAGVWLGFFVARRLAPFFALLPALLRTRFCTLLRRARDFAWSLLMCTWLCFARWFTAFFVNTLRHWLGTSHRRLLYCLRDRLRASFMRHPAINALLISLAMHFNDLWLLHRFSPWLFDTRRRTHRNLGGRRCNPIRRFLHDCRPGVWRDGRMGSFTPFVPFAPLCLRNLR